MPVTEAELFGQEGEIQDRPRLCVLKQKKKRSEITEAKEGADMLDVVPENEPNEGQILVPQREETPGQ